jgi:siderophore synthetase component
MTYSDAHGWQRIAYCLFVNNLCEVIGALSADRPHLERRLWSVVAECLEVYEQRYGTPRSALRTEALLAGVALPAKANLLTRFLRRPDRDATYVPMQNPMAQATRLGEVPPWN